jgi:pimeloyl-ACP methyl ester carboxylesterase
MNAEPAATAERPAEAEPAADPARPAPPPRPPAWEEAVGSRLFRLLSPGRGDGELPAPPAEMAPFEEVSLPRSRGPGALSATWFEGPAEARGAVLLLHPWLVWGRTYFHRRGRVEALRRWGYHALTVDLPGFGGSGPPRGFYDRDVADAVAYLGRRCPALPLHLWGVSSGGYWAHPVLSASGAVAGAMFEDVSPHLLEWGWRQVPWGRPGYLFFQTVLRSAYRFLDMRLHGAALRVAAAAYAAGGDDPGISAADTRALAAASGAHCHVVDRAGHLAAIKKDRDGILELARDTFARAEALRGGS